MNKIMRVWMLSVVIFLGFLSSSEAQFGKNKVLWERVNDNFYRSEHFDIYHSLDLNDMGQKQHFEDVVNHLENSYSYLSSYFNYQIKNRVTVVIYRTHSLFEQNYIVGADFLPEGVGAFVDPERNRMVIKVDFLPPLNKTIITHELTHNFQMDMLHYNLLTSVVAGRMDRPTWFMEGMADSLANEYAPYTRDDIRMMIIRGAAATPENDLPLWKNFDASSLGPYVIGAMALEFIKGAFGDDAKQKFITVGLKESRRDLLDILGEITDGKIDSSEKFDQLHRDFWRKKRSYGKEMIDKPRPHEETDSFKGRSLVPETFPYPIFSPLISLDGKKMAILTIQKQKGVLAVAPVREEIPYKKKDTKRKSIINLNKGLEKPEGPLWQVKNLTPYFPPKNFEYLVIQMLETWPFNGSDISWFNTGSESKVAIFARKNRDHALFIIRATDGKILGTYELSLDQAFSPAFSADGKKIYFSAAHHISRDIYEINLESRVIRNLTNDGAFDTAPVVSPNGKKLLYVAFVGDFQKIFLLDLETGKKEQLTFNRFNDNSPVFSSDGKTIIYTSDEKDTIWNIYTMDLETRTVSQWTDFFTGAFTPHFYPDKNDKIYFVAYLTKDQTGSVSHPNFKLFEGTLKIPLRQYVMSDVHESMIWKFHEEQLFKENIDSNQVYNKEIPPKKWKLTGRSATFGYSTYWGAFGYSTMAASDILENHIHSMRFALNGSSFRIIDYGYLNQKNRFKFGFAGFNEKMPLQYLYYDIFKGNPKQQILNETVGEETGVAAFAHYPLTKFKRLEFSLQVRRRTFQVFGLNENTIIKNPEFFNETDYQLFNFLQKSHGTSVEFGSSFVKDTVIYSNTTQGPLNGTALRFDVNLAPPLLGLKGYTTFHADARKYMRLSEGSLLALRGTGLWSSKPDGSFVLMGGTNMLRTYPYGSLIGNQVIYGSAELRFPLIDAVVFPHGMGIGPLRGLFFADYGRAQFSQERLLPAQKGISLGYGVQLFPFNFVWAWRDLEKFKQRKFDMYIGINF